MEDRFGRRHDYLRISLTDACNFRCAYCMPDEDMTFMPHKALMTAAEIGELAAIFVGMGVRKIRLTGGEPLVRKDFGAVLRVLAGLPVELVMTTNGARLGAHWAELEAAGLRNVNISLDSLRAARFAELTRRDEFGRVWENIETALARGFRLKLNMVVMRGYNEDEVLDFAELTLERGIDVRFIEFMPFLGNAWADNRVVSAAEILAAIGAQHEISALETGPNATSRDYQLKGAKGRFGIISTMSQHFCGTCNRLRLTADGKIKNCLFGADELDLLGPLRNGLDIRPLILASLQLKEKMLGGQLNEDFSKIDAAALRNRSMIQIGG